MVDNVITGVTVTQVIDTTFLTVSNLDCCSEYVYTVAATTIDYGFSSPPNVFRTMPDLSSMKHTDDKIYNGIILIATFSTEV